MTIKMLAVSAVASAMLSAVSFTSAQAADLGPYRPEPAASPADYYPPAFSWNGLYIGANAGYGFGSNGDLDPEGVFGGGQAGYNWQFGRMVVGIEGDFNGADIDDAKVGSLGAFTGRGSTDVDWFGTLRGRIGFAQDRTLIYATGGFAWADVEQKFDGSFGGVDVALRSSGTETGYVVGAGVEQALSANWTTKLEYQYVDLGKVDGSLGSDNLDFHTIRAGLNYKF